MKRRSAAKGFFWKAMEQFSVLGIQFILQLVLARILEPEVYGDLAILLILVSFANVFVQSGFGTALVQKKKLADNDISSVFAVSVTIAAFFYGVIYISAPFISAFFNRPQLAPLLRVLTLILFPYAYNAIQVSILRRELRFKELFASSIISLLISGGISIWLAIEGWGIWTLVIQQLLYSLLISVSLSFIVKWIPRFLFSFKSIKPLFNFGSKVFLTTLVDDIYANLRTIVIGRFYTPQALAFFNRGKSFPDIIVRSINGSLQAVLLPVLSKSQDNIDERVRLLAQTIKVCSFLVFPALAILAGCAPALISVLITDKWLPAVPYLQIFCLFFLGWPITSSNVQALYAVGKSGIVLKLEIARKLMDTTALILSMFYGPLAIAWGASIVGLLSIPLYLVPIQKHVSYKILNQIKDIAPCFILSGIVFIILFLLNGIDMNNIAKLSLQIILGISIYLALAYIFKFEALALARTYFKVLVKNER